jgi:hypothetical protein
VADAFNLPRGAERGTTMRLQPAGRDATSTPGGGSKTMLKVVFVLLAIATLAGAYSCISSNRTSRATAPGPRPKIAAPAQRLATGASGPLAQHTYTIQAHAVVEVARVVGRHDRREYLLQDEAQEPAILVNGLSGGSQEWHLLRRINPPPELTPYDAAAKRRGAAIRIDGRDLRITDLFSSRASAADGPAAGGALPGTLQYGFVATDSAELFVARWTENQIQLHRGAAVNEADVLAALRRP